MRRLKQALLALSILSSVVADLPTEMPVPEAFSGSQVAAASL
jgi:hypothetical protein